MGDEFAIRPDGTPYFFAFVNMGLSHPWCVCGDQVGVSIWGRSGAKVLSVDSNFNIEIQIANMQDMISIHKPDTLLIHPVQEAAVAPLCDQAAEAGIAVFDYDGQIPSDKIISKVEHDFDLLATDGIAGFGADIVGRFLVEEAQRRGITQVHVAEIVMDRGYDSSWQRHDGFVAGIEEAGGADWVKVTMLPDCMHMPDIAADQIMDAFQSDPTYNAIFGEGGGSAGGPVGLEGIDRNFPVGHPDHVMMLSMLCDPPVAEWARAGYIDLMTNHGPWDLVDAISQLMLNYVVLGQPVPEHVAIPLVIITPDNMDTLTMWGCTPLWGDMQAAGIYDEWPLLDFSELGIEQPTLARRMELLGY
jgi:ABC-type sugar transport system substrate-binding protein